MTVLDSCSSECQAVVLSGMTSIHHSSPKLELTGCKLVACMIAWYNSCSTVCLPDLQSRQLQYIPSTVFHLLPAAWYRCRFASQGTAWEAALVKLACHVHASHAELADAMLSMLWGMFSSWGLTDVSPSSGDHLMDTSGVFWLLNLCTCILLVCSVYIGLMQ